MKPLQRRELYLQYYPWKQEYRCCWLMKCIMQTNEEIAGTLLRMRKVAWVVKGQKSDGKLRNLQKSKSKEVQPDHE